MDKITLTREEQIRWAARMGELRARSLGRYRAMVEHGPFRAMSRKDASAYLDRTALVGQVARAWNDRWRYSDSAHKLMDRLNHFHHWNQ